ncbi:MAG: DUF126 domain-containing protein [Nitrosopumilus sp. H8]|nr:MAG: DUF126 domain-containing protein [Nitrosopumilus sp. H13]RNJ78181.1 MAG: DUF126 domain-containing protein [Nitrosopumilus sp. H8]
MVKDGNHELSGRSVRGTVLVFPSGIGSSVGAYTIYSIKSNGSAPLAMVCKKADLAVATGCALADIPLIISEEAFASLETGQQVILDTRAEDMIRRR